MCCTVEPGIYISPDNQNVPEAFRGIGVRIEDDVAVTPSGHEVLTAALPRIPTRSKRWSDRLMYGVLVAGGGLDGRQSRGRPGGPGNAGGNRRGRSCAESRSTQPR